MSHCASLWYRRLSLLHPQLFFLKNGLSQSKDRPSKGGDRRKNFPLRPVDRQSRYSGTLSAPKKPKNSPPPPPPDTRPPGAFPLPPPRINPPSRSEFSIQTGLLGCLLPFPRNNCMYLVDILAPKKKYLATPPPQKVPNSPQTPSRPLGTSRPGEPPPPGEFLMKNRSPTPPGASNSPFPLPEQKKN